MPYESGMDPIHDTRRQFSVRFHLVAIAFLVFDVELLFLYPWAVTARPAKESASQKTETNDAAGKVSAAEASHAPPAKRAATPLQRSPAWQQFVDQRRLIFAGVIVFLALLTLGFLYDWRKGIFQWR
jgi:NADH-quinone oxidoreductase subunit A